VGGQRVREREWAKAVNFWVRGCLPCMAVDNQRSLQVSISKWLHLLGSRGHLLNLRTELDATSVNLASASAGIVLSFISVGISPIVSGVVSTWLC